MGFKLLISVILIKVVVARIRLDVDVDKDQNVVLSYSGTETKIVSPADINNFKIGDENLLSALEKYWGEKPSYWYLRSTSTGHLHRTFNLEPVKKVVSIKSAQVKSITKRPVVVLSQDFENSSKHNIKVNTGISHSIQNTLTTSWSTGHELTVSQDIEYEVNVEVARFGGRTGFSFTTTGGVSEEKSITETIGTTSGMEVELQPGEGVTAVLSANVGVLEIEVEHTASLKGIVAVDYPAMFKGHHYYWGPVQDVMFSGGIENNLVTTETMRFTFYVEARLRVHDKKTGLLL